MSGNKLDEAMASEEETVPARAPNEGRRSLLQIKVDILRAVESGYGKPTQIMYRANLSWNVLQTQLRSFYSQGCSKLKSTVADEGTLSPRRAPRWWSPTRRS